MNETALLYDAHLQNTNQVYYIAVFAVIIAIVSAFGAIYPSLSRRGDPAIVRTGALVMFAICLGVVMNCGYQIGIIIPRNKRDVTVYSGCVSNLATAVNRSAHNIRATTFYVDGKLFHFSSSTWIRGFHNENDIIVEGEYLQITTAGDEVTRILRLNANCQTIPSRN
jgi:hypothetical protein